MRTSGLVFIAVALLLCFDSVTAAEKVDWWESATLYQIYPRSWMDSNGDGVGDLNGITSRLQHLKDIGVTAAWLSPIYESPMVDMGYDISNFTNIDPLFGTLEDLDALIKKAHQLGLKLILDFVPNHTSDKHEWFQKSVSREPGYEDFYVWEDGKIDQATGERKPPSNWITFFNSSAWTWNEERQQYYYHLFFPQQPDLNLNNPQVRQHLIEVMQFWLDRGVDAFRLDAIHTLFEKRFENGTYPDSYGSWPENFIYQINQPESAEVIYEWRTFLDKYQQEHGGDTRAMIGEVYAPLEVLLQFFGDDTNPGAHMTMNLNFSRIAAPITAKLIEDQTNIWINGIWKTHKVANWATGNHDNGRVGTLKGYNIIDALMMVYHALPGASITYYGEEIGMTDGEIDCSNRVCDFRDPERTPMQWDTSFNAGFSTANNTWLPVNPNHQFINVKTERGKPRSTYEIFKGMTKLKKTNAFKAFKEIGGFEYGVVNENVFQVVRTDNVTEYRVLANFGNQLETVKGLTNKVMEYVLLNSYSPHKKREKVDLSKRIYLRPFESIVLRSIA